MDADREWFIKENAVAIVQQLERKVERQRKQLAALNNRLEFYAIVKQALNACRLHNERLLQELEDARHE